MARLLALLLAAWLVAASALAAPRPGPAVHDAPRIPPFYDADPHLAKRVTVRMAKSPLAAIVAELQRQTHVRLAAVGDAADEPAIVFAFDRPLKEVMHHLALLFDYRWTRVATGSDGPHRWRYELAQDRDSKAREQALRDADLARQMEKLQAQLQLCIRLAGETPEGVRREYERLRAESQPILQHVLQLTGDERLTAFESPEYDRALQEDHDAALYRLLQLPIPRALAKFVNGLTPAQWRALQEGDILRFSTRADRSGDLALPAGLAQELLAARPFLASLFPPGAGFPWDSQAALEREEQRLQDVWTHANGFRGWVRLDPILALEPSWQRPSPGLDVHAEPDGVEGGASPHNDLALSQDFFEALGLPIAASYPDHVPPEWTTDPVLGAKRPLTLEPPADPWANRRTGLGDLAAHMCDLLPRIAETYRINVVADAYRHEDYEGYRYQPLPSGAEWPLYRALNRFVLPTAGWTKEGEFFHVRHAFWYRDRLAEIPPHVARRLETQFRRRPQISLQDAAGLAVTLRDAQLRELDGALTDRGIHLGQVFDYQIADRDARGRRDALRAFGSLSRSAQAALLEGRPLRCADLPPPALRWLRLALNERQRIDEKAILPALVPDTSFAVTLRPVQRVVSRGELGFGLSYYFSGTTQFPGFDGEPQDGGIVDAVDTIAPAPGLIAPEPCLTSQALLRLQWPNGREVRFGVILPRADLRTPAGTGRSARGAE